MTKTLRMPSADAPSMSDCSAMRLRSRQVICMTGSTPALIRARLPAQLARRTFEPWLSVTLTASTQSLRLLAVSVIFAVLAPRGGLISGVTAKPPEARRSRRLTGRLLGAAAAAAGAAAAAALAGRPRGRRGADGR